MDYLLIILSDWEGHKVVVDLPQKIIKTCLEIFELLFNRLSFILDNDPHDLIIVWIKTFLNIFQPHDGLLGLVLIVPYHLNIVHAIYFGLNVLI